MGLLIAFAVLSIAVSFLCSVLEAVLLSVTPSYIASLRETRPTLHRRWTTLKERIDQPLAAILTLNTIAHTFGAAGVGAQVGIVFGDGYLALVSAVMTFLILVLSEIIPKSLGASYWHFLAPHLPWMYSVLITAFKPLIKLSDLLTSRMSQGVPETDIRAEIKALTSLGLESGHLDDSEQRVIANILDLHELKIKKIMTPSMVCYHLDRDRKVGECEEEIRVNVYSRYPVLDADEHPRGLVMRAELLEADDEQLISDLERPVRIVNEEASVEEVMNMLMAEHQHMCLVYDEYGTWLGLVTLEDILETILGQPIMDETDHIPNLRRHARRRWEHRLRDR